MIWVKIQKNIYFTQLFVTKLTLRLFTISLQIRKKIVVLLLVYIQITKVTNHRLYKI